MDKMLRMVRGALLAISMALIATPAQANQVTFFSGSAANEVLNEYRVLVATNRAANSLSPLPSDFTININEGATSASIEFSAAGKRMVKTFIRRLPGEQILSPNRNLQLALGMKTFSGLEARAVLAALEFLAEHNSPLAVVRKAAASGSFLVQIIARPNNQFFVNIGYYVERSPAEHGLILGCGPSRSLKYDGTTGIISEVKPFC